MAQVDAERRARTYYREFGRPLGARLEGAAVPTFAPAPAPAAADPFYGDDGADPVVVRGFPGDGTVEVRHGDPDRGDGPVRVARRRLPGADEGDDDDDDALGPLFRAARGGDALRVGNLAVRLRSWDAATDVAWRAAVGAAPREAARLPPADGDDGAPPLRFRCARADGTFPLALCPGNPFNFAST